MGTTLQWSEGLALDLPLMDRTHEEMVNLLAQVGEADDTALCAAWQSLIDHTDAHFGQEDRWMQATHFASGNCHSLQHKVVLQVMREGADKAAQGELHVLRDMARELAMWILQHTQSMDAALALYLRRVGFDPETGIVSAPQEVPKELIHGCMGACSTIGEDEPESDNNAHAKEAA